MRSNASQSSFSSSLLCKSRSAIPVEVEVDAQLRELLRAYGVAICQKSFERILHEFQSNKKNLRDNDNNDNHENDKSNHEQFDRTAAAAANYEKGATLPNSGDEDDPPAVTTAPPIKDETPLDEYRLKAAMLDASLDAMICTDEDGIIVAVNKSAMSQFGFNHSAVQLVGQSVKILVEKETLDHMYDEANIGKRRELAIKRRNGVEFPAIFGMEVMEVADIMNNNNERSSQPCDVDSEKSGGDELFILSIRDITFEQMARTMLAEQYAVQETTKTAIIEANEDAVVATNPKGIITLVNQAAVKLFGYDHTAELMGQTVTALLQDTASPSNHQTDSIHQFLTTREKGVASLQKNGWAKRKDETKLAVMIGLEYVEPSKAEPLFVIFVRDISQQHLLQEQQQAALVDLQHELDAKQHELVQAQSEATQLKRKAQQLQTSLLHNSSRSLPVSSPVASPPRSIGSARNMALEMLEQRATKELLSLLLPPEITARLPAHALRMDDQTEKQSYATVLFADVVDYDEWQQNVTADELETQRTDLFGRFDRLVEKYGLYKIETNGDCYMVSSVLGHAGVRQTLCSSVCHFAFDMLVALVSHNGDYPDWPINLRISIDTGNVALLTADQTQTPARLFFHDLWGNHDAMTVRMASMGIPDSIQTTQAVSELIPDGEFVLEPREMVDVIGQGLVETFYLRERLRSPKRQIVKSGTMFFV